MPKAIVSYQASVDGLEFEEINIQLSDETIERVTIKANENKLHISFFTQSVESRENALRVVEGWIEPIIDRISYETEIPIKAHQLSGISFPQVISEKIVDFISLITMGIPIEFKMTTILADVNRENLANSISQVSNEVLPELGLFRFALAQENSVAKFLFLYSVLLILYGDRQANVDSYIRRVEPTIQENSSPHNPNARETILTRLRNEVAHSRQGATGDKIVEEMNLIMPTMVRVVKVAIEEMLF